MKTKGDIPLNFDTEVNGAIKRRLKKKEQEKAKRRFLAILKKGFHMGKLTIKHRDELYDRR